MNWWNRLLRRGRLEEQLEKELAFHLEQHTADLIARGLSPEEARRQARIILGGPEQVKEACRDARGTRALEDLLQDVRYAFRMFAKNPGTTIVALLSLALAMGPNATLFSVVDRVFLRPVTVQGGSQVFFLNLRSDREKSLEDPYYPDFLEYQAHAAAVGDFTASSGYAMPLNVNGVDELVSLELVSENYFRVLGLRAAVGRTLVESDACFEGDPPVVLSHSLWQRKFGGAADIVGKTVVLRFRPFQVIGVAPRDFREPMQRMVPTDVWVPMSASAVWDKAAREDLMLRGKRSIDVTVRLHDGVTRVRAENALSVIAAQLSREYPATNRNQGIILRPVEDTGSAVLGTLILSLVSLVLLIACANVAGILLGQGEARRREFAMRRALGASRLRLLRQLLSETLLLALVASGIALLLGRWLMQAIPSLLPSLPVTIDLGLRLDSRLLAYTLTLSMLTTLAAGLLPALRASRTDLAPTLKGDTGGGKSRSWFRSILVVGQIACSEFLLVGTGLVVASYFQAQQINPGFDTSRNLLFATLIPKTENPPVNYDEIAASVRAIPGVRRLTYVRNPPLSGSGTGARQVLIPGISAEPVGISGNGAGPEYFSIMGTAVLRGRDFTRSDSGGAAIVNEEMARRFWGDANGALGQFFRVDGKDRQIVGVVETGKYGTLLEDPTPHFFLYTPGAQTMVIEAAGDSSSASSLVRTMFREAIPGVTLHSIMTLRQQLGLAFFPWQSVAGLLGLSAILGIFLSAVGLYGVVSHEVARGSRDIAVRMAMGARPADVLSVVLRQGLAMVVIGAIIGMGTAVAAAKVVASLLYNVSPANPLVLIEAVLAVAVVTFLAVQLPARRAIRTDPMTILRSE